MGGGEEGKGIKWLAWERLCSVKEDGGLGFKSLREFNIAMLTKQAWRIINEENPLVTRIMRARYFPKSSFFDAKLGSNPSYVWRSLLESQAVIRQGSRRRIGNGKSTRIWQVPWLPCPENGYLTTEMPEELKDAMVEGLFVENHRVWDEEVIQDIINVRDRELIMQIPIPRSSTEYSWLWLFDGKGEFTVKSCYRHLRGELECPDKLFWKKLWSLNLPGKVINLVWRACRQVLPTAQALRKKAVNVSPMCTWCHLQEEDNMHVLFKCDIAKEVWVKVGLAAIIQPMLTDNVMTFLERVFQHCSRDQCGMVGMVCWNLWQRRNNWVWNRSNASSFGIQSKAYSMLYEWNRAKEEEPRNNNQQQISSRRWSKPPERWIKINTDAACNQNMGRMGVGCIIRDDQGRFIRARSKVVQGRVQPREVEAMGLREALSWVKEWRSSKCVFECDSKQVVDAIKTPAGRSYFDTIIGDCKDILKHFTDVLAVFVPRSANMIAHLLAKATYYMSDYQEWLISAPDFIMYDIAVEAAFD